MAKHNDIGRIGESLAQQYLLDHGYAILKTNWRRGRYEVDIIAYLEGVIVFVEVKTRSNLDHGDPETFVNRDKQRAYVRMANSYVIKESREEEVRFDIIAIEISSTSFNINHIPNAFSAVDINF